MAGLRVGSGQAAEVSGVSELIDKCKRLGNQDEDIRKVLMRGAIIVRDEAKDLAPVKTGRLRDSIRVSYGKQKQGKDDLSVLVLAKGGKDGAPHAHLVEFGTSTAEKHPFMRPALAATKATVLDTIAKGLQMIIEKVTA